MKQKLEVWWRENGTQQFDLIEGRRVVISTNGDRLVARVYGEDDQVQRTEGFTGVFRYAWTIQR